MVLQLVGEGRGRSYSCGSPSSGGGVRTELQLRFSDKWGRGEDGVAVAVL